MKQKILDEMVERLVRLAGWKPTNTKNKMGLPGWRNEEGQVRYQQSSPDKAETGSPDKKPDSKKPSQQPLGKSPDKAAIQDAVGKVFNNGDKSKPKKIEPVTVSNAAAVRKNQKRILEKHGLDPDDTEMKEMAGFKKGVGDQMEDPPKRDEFESDEEFENAEGEWKAIANRRRNPAQLKADFIKNMDPSSYTSPDAFAAAKGRVSGMSPTEFDKLFSAIAAEEEEV